MRALHRRPAARQVRHDHDDQNLHRPLRTRQDVAEAVQQKDALQAGIGAVKLSVGAKRVGQQDAKPLNREDAGHHIAVAPRGAGGLPGERTRGRERREEIL